MAKLKKKSLNDRSVCNGFLIMLLKPPHAVGPSSPRSNSVGDKQW